MLHSLSKWGALVLGLALGLVSIAMSLVSTAFFAVLVSTSSWYWQAYHVIMVWLVCMFLAFFVAYSSQYFTNKFFSARFERNP